MANVQYNKFNKLDDFVEESELRILVYQNNALFSNFRSSVRHRGDNIHLITI